MKKLWKKVRRGSPARSGEASPKSGSTRGSVASLNIGYEVKEKDLGKLHKAAWIGDLNKVKQLAKKDPSPLDKENRTPLHLACVQGNEHVVQELLEWKAKANIGDNQSRTPLMRAVEFQQEGCVALLLSYHVDIDTVDAGGSTPLHLAVEGANLNIVSMLIKSGASLNAKNKEGFSPLHVAVRNKQEDVCHLLLKERADVNVEDTNLRTPLMYACQDGSISLVKLLLAFNADTVHKDSKGWSADDCAVIQGHHACSQLISDHNIKMSRNTPSSTPRSTSQPPSALNTPRDKDSIGLPVTDGGGDDSDNETISKASGAGGSDSWADSPDVSMGDEVVKKGKPAPKISLAKFAKSIHISESDTDGESVKETLRRKSSTGDVDPDKDVEDVQVRASAAKFNNANRQTSWQSQTSAEDNSWGDSPITPRKGSAQRVSFKRDEELSEIHDITVTESEAESDIHDPVAKVPGKGLATSTPSSKTANTTSAGYVPSTASPGAPVSPSAEKMRALMDELGISDVDDISDISDGASPAPPLPVSPPPKSPANEKTGDSDWDTSVMSDIMTTPRPGILKKWSNAGLEDSQNGKASKNQIQEPKESPKQPKLLIKAPAVESGDESSAWDTTEADNLPQLQKPGPGTQVAARKQKDSVSEWDSDLEDLVNPVTQFNATTPTPPIPPPTATITKENNIQNKNDDDDDDWDSTTDAITPRANAGLQYKEVALDHVDSISEAAPAKGPSPVVAESVQSMVSATPVASGVKGQMAGDDEEDSESNWDSEGDELPSEAGQPPMYNPMESSAPYTPPAVQNQVKGQTSPKPAVESDEDTETISSWELERKGEKKQQGQSFTATLFGKVVSPTRHKEIKEEAQRKEEEEKRHRDLKEAEERENEEKQRREEQERLEREEREEAEQAEKEEREKEERMAREAAERGEEERRKWEREEMRRQEEMQRQWEREEAQKKEQMQREAEEMMEREERERNQAMNSSPLNLMDTDDHILTQQQELNRIDEQFQRERAERERREEENRRRREEEEERRPKEQKEKEEELISQKVSPPALSPKPNVSSRSPVVGSSSPGVYVNIGSSATEQIKQRLQVPPPPPAATASLSSTGSFQPGGDGFDDEDSFMSDNPGDERSSLPTSYYPNLLNQHSMYRPNDPLDDDALSYTSTEFEDQVHSTPGYGKDRDVLANIKIGDPSSLLKVQEYVRDTRHHLEQEKNQRVILENKLKVSNKEKNELIKKFESLTQQKSTLEQTKLDLEAKIRSLEYGMSEEEEKRKNAEILLTKSKEQLARKETQYASELEAKQKAELTMRNLQTEMRTAANTIKDLEDEKEELQRQVTHANNARVLQEQINEDQQKLLHQQQQQQQHTPRDTDNLESSQEFGGDSDKLKAELYALRMEMDRQRSRFKDEITLMGAENEELIAKVEDLRNDIKLNEEALAHATMQYNIQVTSLRAEISTANAVIDKERAAKEKTEAEIESLKTRLIAANQEMDKAIRARNEIERDYRREKETWAREMDRKDEEVSMLKDNIQHLNQRLQTSDTKLNSMENELHISNTTLTERTAQLQQTKQDLDRLRTNQETLDQNYRLEKEHNAKLQAKVENMQEKISQNQHENLSLRQQLDTLKLNSGGLPGSDANEKLNNILTNLRADSDRAKASMEERNSSLVEQVARLKEEVRGSETRRNSLEQELRRLHDEHSDMIKKMSHSEASLQIAMRAKEQLEADRAQLKAEVEKLQQRYQAAHDKSVEAQARVSELVDRLEKAEHSSLFSNQQLANTSASIQGLAKSKSDLDESMQQLQIDNARLEAELKYEKQRADMLYQDLQDSQKVRSSLEALCANLKSTSAHLEDRLGEETARRVTYQAEARDHKTLYDQEIQSRSKLGLRIADLERNKQSSESKLGEEKNRANSANEERRALEARLEAEVDKNQHLQKDVNTLKVHLKSAKAKIKDLGGSPRHGPPYSEFHREVNNMDTFASTPRHQAQAAESGGDLKAELEAKYRMELNRKLDDVNRFLDSQSYLRDRLDTSRTEEEINNLRVKYEQAIAQRETKEMEAKRFKELYESEMKWRMRISDQLQLATEKSFNYKSKLNNERQHRNRLTGSIGNLNSSIVSNNSFELGKVNGFHDDDLSSKIKAELDRSIAKHLEAAPHHHKKPVLRPTMDVPKLSSSLAQSSQDYIDVLKRKYCV